MNGVPPRRTRSDPARLLAWGALALWLISLFLPVIEARQVQGPTSGVGGAILVMGWLGMLVGQFGWLANWVLLAAIGLLLLRRPSPRKCLVVAVFLAVLWIDALTWTDFPNDGGPGPITAYLAGYWAWIAAVGAGIGALLLRARTPI